MANIAEDEVRNVFSSPAAETWDSWDDAYHWTEHHPAEVGGRETCKQLMSAFEKAQREGLAFTSDPSEAAELIAHVA